MFRNSIKLFFQVKWSVLVVISCHLMIQLLVEFAYANGSRTMGFTVIWLQVYLWSILAYNVQSAKLKEDSEPVSGSKFSHLNEFARRILLLFLICVGPAIIIELLRIFGIFQPYILLLGSNIVSSTAVVTLPITAILSLLVLSFFGTWLPAHIVGKETEFGEAYYRGKKQFFWTVRNLIFGPCLVLLAALAIYFLSLWGFGSSGLMVSSHFVLDVPALAFYVVFLIITCFAAIYASNIVCVAYLRSIK